MQVGKDRNYYIHFGLAKDATFNVLQFLDSSYHSSRIIFLPIPFSAKPEGAFDFSS